MEGSSIENSDDRLSDEASTAGNNMKRLGKWDDFCGEREGGGAQSFLVGSQVGNDQVDAKERKDPTGCEDGEEKEKDDDADLGNDSFECVVFWEDNSGDDLD